jgi:predicted amidohydrolase YtcJ
MKQGQKVFRDQQALNQLLKELHDAGWQIAIESVSSQTLDRVIEALDQALHNKMNGDRRHRIEHAVAITDGQLDQLTEKEYIPSIQLNIPASVLRDKAFLDLVRQEPAGSVVRWRDLVEAGVMVTGNSDFPSLDMAETDGPPPGSPIRLLFRAVTGRGSEGFKPESWTIDQLLTAEQAMRLMTINAAYASFDEDTRGSLAPDKLADLVILSADPLAIPAEELLKVEVLVTMVGGKIEWCKPGHESLCAGPN